jgi:hypothetical protein
MAAKFWLFTIFSKNTHKTKTEIGWKGTNSDPPGPIELSSQSTVGVTLCCALYQPQQNIQKCWAKTILLHQTGMF